MTSIEPIARASLPAQPDDWGSARHRTAIGRSGLSMPARQALEDGILEHGLTILDYGSGRGQDAARLQKLALTVSSWDPYFEKTTAPTPHAVVLLTYVLNVIEDAAERVATLKLAWDNTLRTLVVSSRLTWDARRLHGERQQDGVVTSRGTFQHLFSPSELRRMVEEVTGAKCVAGAPGVVYAFRNDTDRLGIIARRTIPQFDWTQPGDHASALAAVVAFTESRGRLPDFEEFPDDFTLMLGSISPKELNRLVKLAANPDFVAQGARRSTLDTLLFLGTELFNGRGPYSSLPPPIQLNVRRFFSSYREASQRSDRLLLKLRDEAYVRGAMRNSVGKMTPSALYVHRDACHLMPVVLRLYEHCGVIAAGRIPDFTLVKLSHDRKAVSWLGYPEFDSDPHPKTAWSYQVSLPDFETRYQDFSTRANRPLLHRKEEFIGRDDPRRAKFERLTKAEVKAGLYAHPHLIGTEDGWAAELARCGVTLRGHRLIRHQG
jgi:DNA phosphorothioation-associated putative methyltransferase